MIPNWLVNLASPQGVVDGLVAATVFGLTVTGASKVAQGAWAWREKLRFALDGKYLGAFEDEEKCPVTGKQIKVLRTGPATFKQNGLKVKVVHKFSQFESWTLRGDILDGRHLAGIYTSDDTYNTGVGSFYLLIKGDRMTGAWTGYDHANSKITTGEYEFRRMIDLQPAFRADKRHRAELRAIATSVFGPGYFKDIEEELQQSDGRFVLAVRPRRQREVIGFAAGYLLPANTLVSLLGATKADLTAELLAQDSEGTIGVLKSIAVLESQQGKGVGHALFSEAEKRLKNLGANSVLVPAWKTSARFNLQNILSKKEYKHVFSNRTYWRASCDAGEFKCPARIDACGCEALFYARIVSHSETTK